MATTTSHPIFTRFTVNELARRGSYGLRYIAQMADGEIPVSKRFRATMAGILNEPESTLFIAESRP